MYIVTYHRTSFAGFKGTGIKNTNVVNIDITIRITSDQTAYTGYI